MSNATKQLFKPIASLRLTVVLMAMAIVLIFAATWAQIDKGIWHIVQQYFRSLIVWIDFSIFLPRDWNVPGGFPWPGGYLLGAALLVNLLAAHAVRFKLNWRRSGILMIHLAVILLLVGEAVTGILAVENQMPIYEGQTLRWGHDIREVELAVVDHSAPEHDKVLVIPESTLKGSGQSIRHHHLPFDVKVERFIVNCTIALRKPATGLPASPMNGLGRFFEAVELREVSGVDEQTVNYPGAIVSLHHKNGRALGLYFVTPHFVPAAITFHMKNMPGLLESVIGSHAPYDEVAIVGQTVEVDSKPYSIYLRFRRHYKPYAIRLIDFSHDYYTGTQVHKSFSSLIHLSDPDRHEDRNILIYMNHPLRYRGETFFQSGWLTGDRGTGLQVVNNPGWLIPYVACTIGGVGLVIHFAMVLIRFLGQRGAA